MKKVVIIGNGAIGLCSAYYLQKEGFDVHVVSACKEGAEDSCSYGNAGMIVPSHFTPLAAPGVIRQGLKWMLKIKSPFHIKPRFNKDLFQWLRLFYAHANQENVDRSKHLLKDLNLTSRDLFNSIQEEESIDFNFERKGLLMLYQTAKYQEEEEKMALQAKALGLDVSIKTKQQILGLEPHLTPNVLGGVLYKSDAHLNPTVFMKGMETILKAKGVHFHYNSAITGFSSHKNSIEGVYTSKGKIKSDEVVVCAGTWSAALVKQLNIILPMQSGKGYSMTINEVPKNLHHPSILCEAKVAMTPMGNHLRIAGTMEIAENKLCINKNRLNGIKEQVPNYFQNFEPDCFKHVTPRVGLRPVSPEGLPYIGRVSKWKT